MRARPGLGYGRCAQSHYHSGTGGPPVNSIARRLYSGGAIQLSDRADEGARKVGDLRQRLRAA